MSHSIRHLSVALFTAAACASSLSAMAQTIERVKMSDNDLSCQQIYNEIGMMDGVIARANQAAPAAAPAADGAGAAVAGAVAQQALGQVAARTGFGGFGGFGGGGGGLGGMFGSMLGQAAQQQAAAATQPQAAPQNQQGAALAQQAQGRKEHLTGVFLSKGCKMGDIQK
jgi:hypothetical protein